MELPDVRTIGKGHDDSRSSASQRPDSFEKPMSRAMPGVPLFSDDIVPQGQSGQAILDAELQAQIKRKIATESRYAKAVEALPKGEFFRNVPVNMKTDVPVIIEAGIAKTVTKQLFKQLQIEEEGIIIRPNVRYDPLGIEIRLAVDDSMFKVRNITVGKKPVIPEDPDIWIWELTPLRQGKSSITILAIVELNLPGVDKALKKETVVFREDREVAINLGYTVSRLTANYWAPFSALFFGSGSIAAGLKWVIERRKEKPQPTEQPKAVAGFVRLLDEPEKKKK